MDIKVDGSSYIADVVDCFCLPETARCKLTDVNPIDMLECPDGHEYCSGDCEYYTEDFCEGL